jgi:4-hydroxy-3-polyprenylbenzoate decarboxylase
MAHMDVREFADRLEQAGEVVRIKQEVDWNLEAGAILRRCNETGSPAPFIEKVKGYPEGYRMFGGLLGGSGRENPFRRVAVAMEMDPDTPAEDLVEEIIARTQTPIKPVIVDTGPCKENILKGKDVDLLKFPAPMVHHGDGGRFIATWHVSVTKDPDSDWVNWGVYRGEVLTRTKMSGQLLFFRHGGYSYYLKHEPKNETMKIATAIGPPPLCSFSAVMGCPTFVSEQDVAGGLGKEPVKLVKCETSDIYVPADSEIVIESTVMPHERVEEGPFGEYTGYRVSERTPRERILYHVDAITFRNDPIMTYSCMGMPIDESAVCGSLSYSAVYTEDFRKRGYPIRGVFLPPWAWNSIIISTKKPFGQYVNELASAVWANPPGREVHVIIVVEETVNPFDLYEVYHDLVFRCHPIRGIHKVEGGPVSPLSPYLSAYERYHGLGAGVIYDCTAANDWPFPPREVRFTNPLMYPEEIQEKVLGNWEAYGYRTKR